MTDSRSEYTLYDLWLVAWRGRWLIIIIVAIATGAAVAYSLTATKWFQAHAVLMHADRNSSSSLQSNLGGLAALANVGGIDAGSGRDESLAILRSRDFAADFIRSNDLLSRFAGFGEEAGAAGEYDMRDAVRFFHEHVLRAQEDRTTGKVTLSMFWTDGETAAQWAASVIELINKRMRERALRDAQTNVEFLKEQLTSNNIVSLQQSISNLLETELQNLMLARGNSEFAFRVIDSPQTPKRRSRPRRTLIVLSTFALSGMFAIVVVFIVNAFRRRPG